jgi:uncharacterized membrane protein
MTLGPGELYALACGLAWAIAVILFKKSGESLSPFALNLFKNALAAVLMALTILALEGPALPPISPGPLAIILLSGFLGIALGDTIYFQALNAIGASRMAVAQTLYSPFVIGLSLLFLGEHLRLGQFCGVALVLFGILLVTYVRGGSQHPDVQLIRVGVGRAAISVFLMALGIVMAKPMLERYGFLWVVQLRIVGGLAGMLLLALLRNQTAELVAAYRGVRHWPQVISGAIVGTYISMMLWLAGYKYAQASIVAVLNELAAIFILAFAVIFLRERVTGRQVLGVLVAVGGVLMVVSR